MIISNKPHSQLGTILLLHKDNDRNNKSDLKEDINKNPILIMTKPSSSISLSKFLKVETTLIAFNIWS